MNNIYLNTIQSICLSNKYSKWYASIITNALLRTSVTGYIEKHHILPKCLKLGGEQDTQNLVNLTAKEHFVCHKLLTKMFMSRNIIAKLTYAVWQITHRYQINGKRYESLKQELSKAYEGIPKSEAHKNNMRKPKKTTVNMRKQKSVPHWNKGGTISEEQKQKQSLKMKGKLVGAKNGFYGKKHSQEFIQRHKEKFTGVPLTESHKAKISKALKGQIPWNKGIQTPEHIKLKMSEKFKGNIVINNGINQKRISPDQLKDYDPTIWKRGSIKKPNLKGRGQIYLTNGKENLRINPEQLSQYDPQIWRRGQTKVSRLK